MDAQEAYTDAMAQLPDAETALTDAQTALDADSENADLIAARDAAQAKVDELNQIIADSTAILAEAGIDPAATPVPEGDAAAAESTAE